MRICFSSVLLLGLHGATAFTSTPWSARRLVVLVPRPTPSLLYASDDDDSFQFYEKLQSQVNEATTESIQAEGRVMELERKVQDVQAEIEEKQRLLKEGDDAWAKEKVTFAVQVADLTNKLQGKEKGVQDRQAEMQKSNQERQNELEKQLQDLKGTLSEAEKALGDERKNAEGIRNKLFQAEDNLEFEQMRFQKEKKDLDERIQQEMSKLAKMENQFVQEQNRYKQERKNLEERIREENNRLSRAEVQLERDSKKFSDDQQELNQKLKEQSKKLEETEKQLKQDREQYKDETGRLRKLVDDEKAKLSETENQLQQEKRDFATAKKDMETRLYNERTKVKELSVRLQTQMESHEKEQAEMEEQIVDEKKRLAEIKEELETETLKFNKEKKRLEENIGYEKRAREVKGRQMAERYDSIQKELTELWQGAKKEARKERLVITEKYEAKLSVVTQSIERLENTLADEQQTALDLQQLIDDVAMEKRKVLDQQKQEEAAFVRQVAAKNTIISGLQGDVSKLRSELQQRDEIIEEYETSFGKILKQSMKLSGKRIRRSGARMRNAFVGRGNDDDDGDTF